MEYELLEDIVFEGAIYSPTCDQCGEMITGKAVTFPILQKIFCDDSDSDCAANWFADNCRYINSIKEDEEPCIPS